MQDMNIVFARASSGTPWRERNVSSAAIVIDGTVLRFDCGEGTHHQICPQPWAANPAEDCATFHGPRR